MKENLEDSKNKAEDFYLIYETLDLYSFIIVPISNVLCPRPQSVFYTGTEKYVHPFTYFILGKLKLTAAFHY